MMQTLREMAPSSYLVKMIGFSEVKLSHYPYESAAFDASGHKWRLIFHPAGKEGAGKDHVSIFARMESVAASEMLMHNWEINVELKFFIYNHNEKKYSVFQDGMVKRYNKEEKECGYAQMLSVSKFNDPKNGYIVQDACIIGVEILVIKPVEKLERAVFVRNPPNNTFTWKIPDFSKLEATKFHYSDEFVLGDRKWRMKMKPKGEKENKAVSVYLQAVEYLPNAVVSSTYAKMKFRILNQKNSEHIQQTVWRFFTKEDAVGGGKSDLISVEDLNDESKGFLVKDKIVLQTCFMCVSDTQLVAI